MKTLDQLLSTLRQRDVALWVEGDRLRYRAAKDALPPDLLHQVKEHKAEIIALLRQSASADQRPPLVPVERNHKLNDKLNDRLNGHLPLSFAQQRLWFLHQFEPESSSNHMPVVLRFTGTLNPTILQQSVREVIRRHEILRTTFPAVNGQPVQVIAPDPEIELPIIDLSHLPLDQREEEAHRLATQAARQPFDLANGPTVRLHLYRLSDDRHLLLWNMHCIVCDGTSSDLFYQELTTFYVALATNQAPALPELPVQYADFAQWQRQWLQGEVLESYVSYWKRQLGGTLSFIELPTDHPRPPLVQTYRGDRYARMLPKPLMESLISLSQQMGTTLFSTLLTAFKVLLYRYSRQRDILITFVSSGRSQIETERMIGFFSNTLILRTKVEGNPTFQDLAKQVHQFALDAYTYQDLPFEKLVEELQPEQSQSRSPLFQVKFTLNPPWTNGRGMAPVQLPDLTIQSLFGYIYHGKTKFDLTLVTREHNQGLGAVFDYNAELFDDETIARMMDHFQTLLEGIVAAPNQPISDLPLLTAAEQQLTTGSRSGDQHATISVSQRFEDQANQTPDAIALVFQDQQLTYWELNRRANQLAHYLQSLGISPKAPIALCLTRSLNAVVGLLGILKAGAVCVSLDPADSPDRLAAILEEVHPSILITESAIAFAADCCTETIIDLDHDWEKIQRQSSENPGHQILSDWLAYIIYPGGAIDQSGICISHHSVVQLQHISEITPSPADVVLQFNSFTSGPALFELWGSLLNGAKLVISPDAPSPEQLGQLIQHHQITRLWLPTRLLHRMVYEQLNTLTSVRQLITAGDVLSIAAVHALRAALPTCQLFNAYSVLENTGLTCAYSIPNPIAANPPIPIGRAIANTQTYILDQHLQSVPIGVIGELYIGGEGLALGYFNRPDLTASRFIANPFSQASEARLYKTGDLARYQPDGTIEHLGPVQSFATVQGLSIQTGKIETALSQHPDVQEAVVRMRTDSDGSECLIAYVVVRQHQTTHELRHFLKHKLSAHLIPSVYILLDRLPLTCDGEIDERLLPLPEAIDQDLATRFVAAQDETELQLTQIWETVLGIHPIGIEDNFFDLGGYSLLAVRLFAQIETVFDKNLPLTTILKAPTIKQLAAVLRQNTASEAWDPLVEIQAANSKFPLFCIHGGGFNVLIYRSLALNLGPDQSVYGLQARGLDGSNQPIRDRIEEIATDYVQQIQRIQPEGPYCLAGLSNGGNIALEMAQQLRAQGQEVAILALFDCYAPDSIRLLPPFPRLLSSVSYVLRYRMPQLVAQVRDKGPELIFDKILAIAKSIQTPSNRSCKTAAAVKLEPKNPANLSSQPNPLDTWMDYISQSILDHSSWSFLTPKAQLQDVEGSLSETLKQLEEAYGKVHKAYQPKAYSAPILLFRARETPPGFWIDPCLGWDQIAVAGLEIHEVPGNHTSLMESPILAKTIKAHLDNAQATG